MVLVLMVPVLMVPVLMVLVLMVPVLKHPAAATWRIAVRPHGGVVRPAPRL